VPAECLDAVVPPHEAHRLDRARTQLHHREPPSDVALATGFADQAHLTRKFKSAFGLTPSHYQSITHTHH